MRRDIHTSGGDAQLRAAGPFEAFSGALPKAGAKGILKLLVILAFAALFAACAAKGGKPAYKQLPPKKPTTQVPQAPKPPPEEVRTNARPSTVDVVTPQRQASMRLVDKGKGMIDGQDYERAAATFRDAVNVDASNGVAYYYFAVAEARQGQSEVAMGLLDKAEALLGADQEWMGKIVDLRIELETSGTKGAKTSF